MKTCNQVSRLLRDRSGNFGMMTAILLPVLIGAGGIALDLTNMMMSKTQLQEAADSAALAASTALATGEAADEAAAEALARQFFTAQMGNYIHVLRRFHHDQRRQQELQDRRGFPLRPGPDAPHGRARLRDDGHSRQQCEHERIKNKPTRTYHGTCSG